MYINFQQNQVKTQVMTVLLDIKLPRKEIIDTYGWHDGQTDGRTDKRTGTNGQTDTHRRMNRRTNRRTDRRTDIASDNIRYFFQKRKKC